VTSLQQRHDALVELAMFLRPEHEWSNDDGVADGYPPLCDICDASSEIGFHAETCPWAAIYEDHTLPTLRPAFEAQRKLDEGEDDT